MVIPTDFIAGATVVPILWVAFSRWSAHRLVRQSIEAQAKAIDKLSDRADVAWDRAHEVMGDTDA